MIGTNTMQHHLISTPDIAYRHSLGIVVWLR